MYIVYKTQWRMVAKGLNSGRIFKRKSFLKIKTGMKRQRTAG